MTTCPKCGNADAEIKRCDACHEPGCAECTFEVEQGFIGIPDFYLARYHSPECFVDWLRHSYHEFIRWEGYRPVSVFRFYEGERIVAEDTEGKKAIYKFRHKPDLLRYIERLLDEEIRLRAAKKAKKKLELGDGMGAAVIYDEIGMTEEAKLARSNKEEGQ